VTQTVNWGPGTRPLEDGAHFPDLDAARNASQGYVHEPRYTLEPVLGDHHGQPVIVNQPLQRGQNVLRTLRVELARRFI